MSKRQEYLEKKKKEKEDKKNKANKLEELKSKHNKVCVSAIWTNVFYVCHDMHNVGRQTRAFGFIGKLIISSQGCLLSYKNML
jgi:hypothetical protein